MWPARASVTNSLDVTNGQSDQPSPGTETVEYRLRPAVALRVVGLACVAMILPVGLEVLRRSVAIMDLGIVSVLAVALLVGIGAVVAVGAWLLLDRRPRLRLDSEGFLSRTTYGLRTSKAAWRDVRGVRRVDSTTGPVLVVELADDETTTILPRYLDGRLSEIEEQIRSRLNTAYGYRPFT